MRDLTREQKKLLDNWYEEQKEKGKEFGLWWKVDKDDDFSYELYEKIDDINPCEIFYQNVNNYIQDKEMKELDDKIKRWDSD